MSEPVAPVTPGSAPRPVADRTAGRVGSVDERRPAGPVRESDTGGTGDDGRPGDPGDDGLPGGPGGLGDAGRPGGPGDPPDEGRHGGLGDGSSGGPAGGGADRMTGGRGDFWRVARTPKMVGLFVLLLVAALVCVRLGAWQLDRATSRGAAEAEAEHAAVLAQDPAPIGEVLAPQTSFRAEHLAVPVEVTGTYDPDQQVLVPDRAIDGQDAVLVVTALWVTEGPHTGAMLPVLRGWVEPDAVSLGDGDPVPVDATVADALEPPAGEQTVTGYLKDSEAGVATDLGDGTVGAISSAELASLWGGPTWSGYLVEFTTADGEREATSPAGLAHATPPGMAEETGLNIQNLAYAVEWVIFGGFALMLWWRSVRDETTRRREDAGIV